jgi:hypothetical protein
LSASAQPEGKKIVTLNIHLARWPWAFVQGDPPAIHNLDEAIAKVHRFCHEIHRVPVTWLATWSAVEEYADTLAGFHREYGDEVAIMEGYIATNAVMGGEAEKYQGWVEAAGLTRPGSFHSREPELRSGRGFHDMPADEQQVALEYLKGYFDKAIGQNTRALATPHVNHDTVRAMKAVGLDVLWGYCWDYFCEGINNKGSLFHPFYISEVNHNAPVQEPDGNDVLALHWGTFSPVIGHSVETHSRGGQPGYCLNALELANRSEGHDKFDFHRKVIAEWASQAAHNPYVHIPIQLEGVWLDEGDVGGEWYDQYPSFNPANTEVFYAEVETALSLGAEPMTMGGFADWHRTNIGDTPPMTYYSEDFLPDLRSKGKDQAYQPMVVCGDKTHQYYFLKSHGFNYVRKYRYVPPADGATIATEYPFDVEPRVFLDIKRFMNVRAGIVLSPEGAKYELADFTLTAYEDDPDYAAILWEANLPSYVGDADIATGGAVTGFRTVRDRNVAILFADLKQGGNPMVFRSDLPGEHIKIVRSDRVGRRWEVWIENDAEEARLHSFSAMTEPGLRIGGWWWDGRYSRTIYRYGWGGYDRFSGGISFACFYPVTMKINHGLTRVSFELL